jgi:hypothetical protein
MLQVMFYARTCFSEVDGEGVSNLRLADLSIASRNLDFLIHSWLELISPDVLMECFHAIWDSGFRLIPYFSFIFLKVRFFFCFMQYLLSLY